MEVKQLRCLNAEKDGEISILRSKMKETLSINQIQQQKTVSEYRDKLLLSEKEIKSIKSQLEFKVSNYLFLNIVGRHYFLEFRNCKFETTFNRS